MTRILVVDDEPQIRRALRTSLQAHGYEVDAVGTGAEALVAAAETSPELVFLDLGLPDLDGTEVIRRLRSFSEVPVIVLSVRDRQADKVAALDVGADDYVTKPFEARELVARIGAVLRRTSGSAAGPGEVAVQTAARPASGPGGPDIERFFDLEIDRAAREVRRGTEALPLTRAEFDLLATLAAHAGVAMTREQLGEHVFGEAFDAFDRTIDSHVKNLRHKLGGRPDGGAYVDTVRGIGYRGARA